MLLLLGLVVPTGAGLWKTYEKMGQPGWVGIVPIYNLVVMAKLLGKEDKDWQLALIPFVGLYFFYFMLVDLAKAFGKDQNFALGLLLAPFFFWPALGYGDARGQGRGQP